MGCLKRTLILKFIFIYQVFMWCIVFYLISIPLTLWKAVLFINSGLVSNLNRNFSIFLGQHLLYVRNIFLKSWWYYIINSHEFCSKFICSIKIFEFRWSVQIFTKKCFHAHNEYKDFFYLKILTKKVHKHLLSMYYGTIWLFIVSARLSYLHVSLITG